MIPRHMCCGIAVLLLGGAIMLGAQEADSIGSSSATDKAETLLEKTLGGDIETAGYYELLAWCRELGLDDTGTREALQRRLYAYYRIPAPGEEEPPAGKTRLLEIKSARETQYFTIEQVDEDYVLLLGDVLVEIREEEATHRIRAHRIVLNESENILSAEGGIEYTLIKGNEEEVFRGERLTFDVESWQGVFFGGGMAVDRVVGGENVRFRFSGESISRLEGNTVVIDKGRITSCENEEDPHYHIRARKIWVLAPNEWAILHAVLYVGRVPLLYLPFFFRPGEEFFFHPAIGYRDREGNFIQTTTYLIGQKPRSSSALSFLAATEQSSAQYEAERHGLFLRQNPEKPIQTPDNRFLKMMLDLYSRLGGFAGVEGSFPKVDFKGGIAFSRTVYLQTFTLSDGTLVQAYTPWIDDNGFRSSWNTSYLFGLPVPFRFGVESSWKLGEGSYTLGGRFEYFSDPFFTSDFYNRAEDTGLTRLVGLEPIEDATVEGETRTLTWEVSAKTDFSQKLNTPKVKTISFPYITGSLLWQSRENTGLAAWNEDDDPSRLFYYPVSLKLPSASFQMLGDLVNVVLPAAEQERKPEQQSWTQPVTELRGALRRPRISNEIVLDQPSNGKSGQNKPGRTEAADLVSVGSSWHSDPVERLRPPEKKASVPVSLQKTPLQFVLSYQFRPNVTLEQSFNTDNLQEPEDVSYDLKYTTFDTQGVSSLDHSLRILENVLLWSGNLYLSGNYRNRYRQSFASDTDWNNLVLSDQMYSQLNVKTTQGLDYRPFADDPVFGSTSLSYDVSWTLLRYIRDLVSPLSDPLYYVPPPEWTQDTVTQHSVQASLAWQAFDASNTLSLFAQLPPRPGSFTASLNFTIWLLTTTVNSVFQDTDSTAYAWANWSDWEFQPLVLRETLKLGERAAISEELRFDLNNSAGNGVLAKSLSTLNLWNFSGSFSMDFMKPQQFNLGSASWEDVPLSVSSLRPTDINMSYHIDGRERLFWKNRIRIGTSINTSWSMNIQKFTENSLDFSLTFDFWLYKFLNLSITTSSYNNRTFQYFPTLAQKLVVPYVNPIQDLFQSFNFFDIDDRERSAFNLRSITVEATHYLHDWVLRLSYQGKPELNESAVPNPRYEWGSSFSVILQWLPIPELRSNLQGELDVETDRYEFSLRG